MDERDKDLIAELRRRLPPDVMNHIRKMIAFGSRVQGNAEEDSDLDLLILVDYKTGDLEKRIEDVAYQLMWDHDFNPILSIKVLSENRYSSSLEAGYSFFKNVEREGVAL